MGGWGYSHGVIKNNPMNFISNYRRESEEGGCGVLGLASSKKIKGKFLLRALRRMRNRGNGKGGGIAATIINPLFFGVSKDIMENAYMINVAFLDAKKISEFEKDLDEKYEIIHKFCFEGKEGNFEVPPPKYCLYFAFPKEEALNEMMSKSSFEAKNQQDLEDEFVYRTTFYLNKKYYSSEGEKYAFVASHGKNMIILKLVGYADEVITYYGLEDLEAHIWIGHHRYPTKGKVWHPGGAHPFLGMHDALIHNGDFANYTSIRYYLKEFDIEPLFLTDTEVAVLLFDLLKRRFKYPLDWVIEVLAPTTERDFYLLPPDKQKIYEALQATHIHGSPDGPWFFQISSYDPPEKIARLICITDTSMLRPQVFAHFSNGDFKIAFSSSEKHAIDTIMYDMYVNGLPVIPYCENYWFARGGSHDNGGAFIFEFNLNNNLLRIYDKFGKEIPFSNLTLTEDILQYRNTPLQDFSYQLSENGVAQSNKKFEVKANSKIPIEKLIFDNYSENSAKEIFELFVNQYQETSISNFFDTLDMLLKSANNDPASLEKALWFITLLHDRHLFLSQVPPNVRKWICSLFITKIIKTLETSKTSLYIPFKEILKKDTFALTSHQSTILIDASDWDIEGDTSLAYAIQKAYKEYGFKKMIVYNCSGHRFIGAGLGPQTNDVVIHIYGSPGDYLGSGLDGAKIYVHNDCQNECAQILKYGEIYCFGNAGQCLMYGAKGGTFYVMKNTGGRPLINAVGKAKLIINGTVLDYLAESFMAGDPLSKGGFAIVNGINFLPDGTYSFYEDPYPGSNLLSLASGGAIYIRDPNHIIENSQLNGGKIVPISQQDWEILLPYIQKNETLFGISIDMLLSVNGKKLPPEKIYRKVIPDVHRELLPEEEWAKGK